jgi:signal transduction histidine kinase
MKRVQNFQSGTFEKYEISVIDDGIGIDDEDVCNLFKPLALNSNLSNKNRDAKVKSNGIGLSISKKIAQSLGGDLILIPSE